MDTLEIHKNVVCPAHQNVTIYTPNTTGEFVHKNLMDKNVQPVKSKIFIG